MKCFGYIRDVLSSSAQKPAAILDASLRIRSFIAGSSPALLCLSLRRAFSFSVQRIGKMVELVARASSRAAFSKGGVYGKTTHELRGSPDGARTRDLLRDRRA